MKTTINEFTSGSELEFAYQVRRALDERATSLPESTTTRLAQARKRAIARKKSDSGQFILAPRHRLAGAWSDGFSNPLDNSLNWLGRLGLAIPLLVLVLGSIGIYQYEQDRRIDALAELDVAVLGDELPLTAYLDHGFDTYINKHGE